MSLASALSDRPLSRDSLFLGEVGLGGEIRPVVRAGVRLKETARLGFKTLVASRYQEVDAPAGIEILRVGGLDEVLKELT
jgi:DNA repair protein RadA/Sms